MSHRLLYIFTQAPYSRAAGQEGLDAVLVASAFELRVSLLFLHDGIYQLKTEQISQADGLKQFTKTYAALQDFGIEEIYTHDLSRLARGISDDEMIVTTRNVDSDQIRALIAEQDKVFTF